MTLGQALLKKMRPKFWDHHDVAAGADTHLFSFRRKWVLVVVLTAVVALIPLFVISVVNDGIARDAIESEIMHRSTQLLNTTQRTLQFFLAERKTTLEFVLRDNSAAELAQSTRLSAILNNLKTGLGGFVDIAAVDASGNQIAYAGPFNRQGTNYREEKCFREVLSRGFYISEVDPEGDSQHNVIMAIKKDLPDGNFLVLRTTLTIKTFSDLLRKLELGDKGDTFIINLNGNLQTSSRLYGNPPGKVKLPLPSFSEKSPGIQNAKSKDGSLIIGYAYLPETSFILMIMQDRNEMLQSWNVTRLKLLGLLALGVAVILFAIICMATYLIHRIHAADQKRIIVLHQVEYANKMASIGRLAAGVAHEINNPLAVISEKAGLLQDLMKLKPDSIQEKRWLAIVEEILSMVKRCGAVTRRLLNFARHTRVKFELLDLREVIHETLAFLSKEAEFHCIDLSTTIPRDLPLIESDRGSLEQILLNLFNNALAAMNNGGRLELSVRQIANGHVSLTIADNGCGIPEEDIKRIFEPFFTTKDRKGSTGLGLSITYGLVKELGGRIDVHSAVGRGTRFEITLPFKRKGNNSMTRAAIDTGAEKWPQIRDEHHGTRE
jgi:signal transduction histidine kinase